MSSTCVLVPEHSNWQPCRRSRTARSARERVREEMTAEILAVAREHLAKEGAAALSLRSVARDLELAPSALYRYFDGRDALLSALIMAAYESLADEAERAADQAQRSGAQRCRALARGAARHPAVGARAPSRMGPHLRHAGARVRGAPGHGRALRPRRRSPGAPRGRGEVGGPLALRPARQRHVGTDAAASGGGAGRRRALPRHAGRRRWSGSSRPGRPSWASSASRSSGTGATPILDPEAFFEATVRNLAEDIGLA